MPLGAERVRALDSAKENTSHNTHSQAISRLVRTRIARSTKKRVVLLSLLFE